ncbi:MAG: hypothetical protein ACRD3T_08640 [Terriglobia bacterium]
MKINGRGLRDHIRLLWPLLALIAGVWALRMGLAAAHAPRGLVQVISVSVATAFCVLLAVLFIHARNFGGYSNVVLAVFLLALWEQILIVAAIAFTALTGVPTIYCAPEFSGGLSTVRHIEGQMTFALGMATLLGSGMGCLLFWLLRRIVRPSLRSSNG